jgi:hypothetical protein
MKERAGKIHVSCVAGGAQQVQDIGELLHVRCLDTSAASRFEQKTQPFVPEALDHWPETVTDKVTFHKGNHAVMDAQLRFRRITDRGKVIPGSRGGFEFYLPSLIFTQDIERRAMPVADSACFRLARCIFD